MARAQNHNFATAGPVPATQAKQFPRNAAWRRPRRQLQPVVPGNLLHGAKSEWRSNFPPPRQLGPQAWEGTPRPKSLWQCWRRRPPFSIRCGPSVGARRRRGRCHVAPPARLRAAFRAGRTPASRTKVGRSSDGPSAKPSDVNQPPALGRCCAPLNAPAQSKRRAGPDEGSRNSEFSRRLRPHAPPEAPGGGRSPPPPHPPARPRAVVP